MTFYSVNGFPNSIKQPFLKTSQQTNSYNCIAWAFEDASKWYWPDDQNIYYWPPEIPRAETLDAFIALFRLKEYEICNSGDLETGFMKISIFTNSQGTPTHAARQLPDGSWTSKLGPNMDVQHTIFAIEGGGYGNVAVYMKRRIIVGI